MRTFEKLHNRYVFTGELILLEAAHVGSGEGDERVDSTFARSNGRLYIPGSSLRGALRSTIEKISATIGIETCLLIKDYNRCISVNDKTQKDYRDKIEKHEKEEVIIKWLDDGNLCNTCKLFGSPYFASKLKITDLQLKNKSISAGSVRYGIGIDRDTETAKEGALFQIEVLEKQNSFNFELIAENMENNDYFLLSIGLNEMLKGRLYIGAKSSIGLGKCILKNLKIEYFDDLKAYLVSGYKKTDEKFIDDNIKLFLGKSGGNGDVKSIAE